MAAGLTADVAARIIENGLPERTFLSINIPDVGDEEIKGIRLARLGIRIYDRKVRVRKDPQGRDYYWLLGGMIHTFRTVPPTRRRKRKPAMETGSQPHLTAIRRLLRDRAQKSSAPPAAPRTIPIKP